MSAVKVTKIASGSRGNCWYVSNGETAVLFDLGVSWKKLLRSGVDLSILDAVLITHDHNDHWNYETYKKLDRLEYISMAKPAPIELECQKEVYLEVAGAMGPSLSYNVDIFPVEHDPGVPCVAYYHRPLRTMYATDCRYIPQIPHDCKILIAEANYSKARLLEGGYPAELALRVATTHQSIETLQAALMIAIGCGLKLDEVWLCHISAENGEAEEFKSKIQRLTGVPVYY